MHTRACEHNSVRNIPFPFWGEDLLQVKKMGKSVEEVQKLPLNRDNNLFDAGNYYQRNL